MLRLVLRSSTEIRRSLPVQSILMHLKALMTLVNLVQGHSTLDDLANYISTR